MKRYLIYLVVFFVLICNIAFAQTDPPTPPAGNGNGTTVGLDCSGGSFKFDNHFPFDRSFIINIKNIPAAVNKIEIRLQANSDVITNYKQTSKTRNSSSDVVLPAWERHNLDTATTGTITVINYLKYNTDFLVKIIASSTTPLKESQKTELQAAMTGDPGIGEVINKMGKAFKSDPPRILFDYSTDIFAALKKALQKKNSNYGFTEPDSIPVIMPALKKFRQGILNMYGLIATFQGTRPDTDPHVKSLRNAFNALNWGSITRTSLQDSAFIKTLDALKAAQPATGPSHGTDIATLGFIGKTVGPIIEARDELMTELIKNVALIDAYEESALNTSYDPNFVTNSSFYITLDIGIPYVARIDRVIMYSGVNIYFRPIDKTIPLERYRLLSLTRASLLLGVSLTSIEKAHERKGLIGSNALVLGLGYRTLPFLKLNAGTFCHYRYDTNPVIGDDRYHFSTSPFIGLSIDADIKQFFSAFGTPFQ